MEMNTPFYISKLNWELESRKQKNSQYSMRSFAEALDLNPGTLSRILKGTRVPSLMMGRQLVTGLNLDKKESELFLNSLATEKMKNQPQRLSQDLKNFGILSEEGEKDSAKVFQLELDHYRYLSDWIHYALMELTFVEDFQNDYEWMAKKLGRKPQEVKDAVERLINLNLLENREGKLEKTHTRLTTNDKSMTTKPLKKLQVDLLNQAMKAINDVEYKRRSSVSMTMAINPKNLEKARSACVEFSEKLCDLLEEGPREEVYNLIINLSPVCFEQTDTEVDKKGAFPNESVNCSLSSTC